MARLDVYRNSGPHAESVPYLLDVQSDLLQVRLLKTPVASLADSQTAITDALDFLFQGY